MDNIDKMQLAIVATIGTISAGLAAAYYLKVRKEERAKRTQIWADYRIDRDALLIATDTILKKIQAGKYHAKSYQDVQDDFDAEIEFQKIALRLK